MRIAFYLSVLLTILFSISIVQNVQRRSHLIKVTPPAKNVCTTHCPVGKNGNIKLLHSLGRLTRKTVGFGLKFQCTKSEILTNNNSLFIRIEKPAPGCMFSMCRWQSCQRKQHFQCNNVNMISSIVPSNTFRFVFLGMSSINRS